MRDSSGTADAAGVGRARGRPRPGKKLPGGSLADRLSLPSERIVRLLADLTVAGAVFSDRRLAAARQVVLVTYRRDGRAVATPVWAAKVGDLAYVRTQRMSGKAMRLARDGGCLIAPCGPRGSPLGGAVRAVGRLMDGWEESVGERALAAKYGLVRRICAAGQDMLRVDMCYLELHIVDNWSVRPDRDLKV